MVPFPVPLRLRSAFLALLLGAAPFAQGGDGGDGTGTGTDTPPPTSDRLTPPPPEAEEEVVPSWVVWWTLNQDYFLDLRRHVHESGDADYDDGFYVGRGWRDQEARSVLRPSAEVVAAAVLPVLEEVLAEDRSTPVQRAALLALARAARNLPDEERIRLAGLILPHLRDANFDVAEAAVLGLGILGHFTAAAPLAEILGDTPAGRELVGGGEVPYRTRAFAAYALGLLGAREGNEDVRRFAVHHLARATREDRGRWKDLEVASVLALGMVPLADEGEELGEAGVLAPAASASRVGELCFLLEVYENPAGDRLARAHAADALGRLFATLAPPRREHLKEAIAVPLLGAVRRGLDPEREILQSTVLALGSIGDDDEDPPDREIRRALLHIEEVHRDRDAASFALLSLARTTARAGIGKNPGGGLPAVRGQLITTLVRGESDQRPWAALAMGVLAHGLRARGADVPPEFAAAVRAALRTTSSPQETGAYCLAAGLLGDASAVELLERHLGKTRNEAVRSYAGLGLGLVPAPEMAGAVGEALVEAAHRPSLVEFLALAKALLDDRQAVHEIAALLDAAQSLDGKQAFLLALGRIGDVRSIDPLVAMIRRPTVPAEVRAGAIRSLGMVVEPEPIPWPAVAALGVNFRAPTETLFSDDEKSLLESR
ncbi:MAG: hypothetical protein AB1726_10030 [Planctomycetota bacterium]